MLILEILNSPHYLLSKKIYLFGRKIFGDLPSNITKYLVNDAGHLPWMDQPEEVRDIFDKFIKNI
jgi:pimeloyl-ACP methyl ester carboxylesterase